MTISLNEALAQGIDKIRMPQWRAKGDYIQLHITEDGHFGPWAYLHSAYTVEGVENPYPMIITSLGGLNDKSWEIYDGS